MWEPAKRLQAEEWGRDEVGNRLEGMIGTEDGAGSPAVFLVGPAQGKGEERHSRKRRTETESPKMAGQRERRKKIQGD